jgi:hypothetical protein
MSRVSRRHSPCCLLKVTGKRKSQSSVPGREWDPYWCDIFKSAWGQESNPEVLIQNHRTSCIWTLRALGQTVQLAEFLNSKIKWLFYILWTVHRDTYTWEWPKRSTLFLINLFHSNYLLHFSNQYLFIIRRLFLCTQHIVFYHPSMGCLAANTMWQELHIVLVARHPIDGW